MATLITPEVLEDIENSLACMDPVTTKRVLRVMARRFPQDFKVIVKGKRTAEFPRESETPPPKYRSIEEFERDPGLKVRCAAVATKELYGGRTIYAIKEVMQLAGIGLKDAMNFVVSLPAYQGMQERK